MSLLTCMHEMLDTIPFGFLRCTCEKYPRVLAINEQMLRFLGTSRDTRDWEDFLSENIFFMIPFADRDRFRSCLEQALTAAEPISIRHRISRSTGETATVQGWLGTRRNEAGEREYTILYISSEITGIPAPAAEENSYFRALESAYNVIYEVNMDRHTAECIFGKDTSDIGKLYDVRMTTESAVNFWLNNYIVEEDRPHMQDYFDRILTPGVVANAKNPMQTEFRVAWDDQVVYSFIGVAIQLDSASLLFCCRDTAKVQYSSLQAREIRAMRKLYDFMDDRYLSEKGVLGAAILDCSVAGRYAPVYASHSVIDYLGLRYDQYLHYVEEGLPAAELWQLAADHGIEALPALCQGSGPATAAFQHEKDGAACTLRAEPLSGQLLELTAIGQTARQLSGIPAKGIFARTFGYFDLFVDGVPVVFSSFKEKELMALLIDRHGGTLTSADAISFLWEDAAPDDRLKTRYRKLAMGLKHTLEQNHIARILINRNGVRSIDTTALTCDYYELLAGNTKYVQSFHNSYMTDYSWAERTLGSLWDFS